jgi:hypothetical protein
MTKAERLQLLRCKLRRNRPIQEPAHKRAPQIQKQAYRFHPYGLGNPKDLPEVGAQWIYAPREAKDPAALKPHRIKRVSPLTKISEQLPKKFQLIS